MTKYVKPESARYWGKGWRACYNSPMKTGLIRLLENPDRWLGKARVALVANPTTVDASLQHAADMLQKAVGSRLVRLFGPEHGIRGLAQYMVDVDDERDEATGLPVASLYGKTFASLSPRPEQLAELDILIFDIQDVGSRYYTYAATMALCMRVAAKTGTKVVVLDRPNPIGGEQVEGGGIAPGLENFCGLYPVPQRHGLTVGELALLYNTTFNIGCELEVIACEGWQRSMYYDQTGLPWVMPSPNMPTLDTALVYPGMCLLEATNISEGRGTTRPFELFGAPYVSDIRALQEVLLRDNLPGVIFRPCAFVPTFDKFRGETCRGLQMHVTSRTEFLPYQTGLAIVRAFASLYPKQFAWRAESYEFRDDVPAIDLLTGDVRVREGINRGDSLNAIMRPALSGADEFYRARPNVLLY